MNTQHRRAARDKRRQLQALQDMGPDGGETEFADLEEEHGTPDDMRVTTNYQNLYQEDNSWHRN
jgi:hypothetical protein